MADPTKISVVIDVPILGQILEAVRALGAQSADLSDRLQAIEARLTVAPTADGASFIWPDDRSPYHRAGDDGHITPSADEAFATAFHSATYQPELAPDQTSSIPKHVFASNPRPRSGRPADRSALGKKRKRADSDQSGRTAPGFQMRESANQIEENRRETLARSHEATPIAEAPSRSESPLDKRDAESTSDGGFDATASSSFPTPSKPTGPSARQNGRVRKQTPRQTGFVGLPTKKEINRDSRLTKRGGQR
ncbi:hypothetical protein D6D10_09663 [Aureobasidium pullulans]|uniref:Uncharacterized protein n=1 Tax=Aureobasidium pullulans TaxID=5580 RepID=A0A4S9E0Z0_AURPU|nr:hypothetical protein D6D10_09663 [Aureobasidium pullulans]